MAVLQIVHAHSSWLALAFLFTAELRRLDLGKVKSLLHGTSNLRTFPGDGTQTAIQDFHQAAIKIACVGDSITSGFPYDSARGDNPAVSGYPWHLGQLLGEDYVVKNFGKEATTVVSGSKSYMSTDSMKQALAFNPDKVLLMFGANDAKENRLTKLEEEFETEYGAMIQMFLKSRPDTEVYVMIPPPLYDDNIYGPELTPPSGAGGMRQNVYNKIVPAKLHKIALKASARTIDIQRCFLRHRSCGDVATNCCDWEAQQDEQRDGPHTRAEITANPCLAHDDAIHPNDQGYKNMAQMVWRAIIEPETDVCDVVLPSSAAVDGKAE